MCAHARACRYKSKIILGEVSLSRRYKQGEVTRSPADRSPQLATAWAQGDHRAGVVNGNYYLALVWLLCAPLHGDLRERYWGLAPLPH